MASKKFDASLKDLMDTHPADWAAFLGAKAIHGVRLIDPEVSTVSAAADKAMVIDDGQSESILHPEPFSGYDADASHNVWWYNSVLHRRHRLLVQSVVLLLRRVADGPEMTGVYGLRFPHEVEPYHTFRYRVVRLWQMQSEQLLGGGIGTLPLAPLTDDAAATLPEVVRRIDYRLAAEAPQEQARKIQAATTVLMGLRHPPDLIQRVLQGIWPMWEKIYEDSSVVQESMKRAEERGFRIGEERGVRIGEERAHQAAIARARTHLTRLGQRKFGQPDPTTIAAIDAISDLDRLEALAERVLSVSDWIQLLA